MPSSDITSLPAYLRKRAEWVALSSLAGVGPQTFFTLLNILRKHELSIGEFWEQGEGFFKKNDISKKIYISIKNFNKEYTIGSFFESILAKDLRVLLCYEDTYSDLLRETASPPPVLYYRSQRKNTDILNKRCAVAVVGSRKMTNYGKMVTTKLVSELASAGCAIISGFMYGVDVQAHRAAINHNGLTVGVLGYGHDFLLRGRQAELAQTILDRGGIFFSEYPPSTPALAGRFVARNRIVAGLSHGVLVSQAARKSGSHITSNFALEEGREVFAVPGPITSEFAEGTKWLVNNGAILVSSGSEVVSHLSAQLPELISKTLLTPFSTQSKQKSALVEQHSRLEIALRELLAVQPYTAQEIWEELKNSGFSTADMNLALSNLELNGTILRSGSYYESRYC